MKFSDKLKTLREEKGWTQKELAEKLGLAKSTISLYEIEKREPNTEITIKIADLFGISVDELLRGTHFKNEPKIVLYGADGKLVDISDLSKEDQDYILQLAERFKKNSKR
jgi:transcriptional regulator with XRE-family HTH domain